MKLIDVLKAMPMNQSVKVYGWNWRTKQDIQRTGKRDDLLQNCDWKDLEVENLYANQNEIVIHVDLVEV